MNQARGSQNQDNLIKIKKCIFNKINLSAEQIKNDHNVSIFLFYLYI